MTTFSCLCFHTAGEWTCIALRAGPGKDQVMGQCLKPSTILNHRIRVVFTRNISQPSMFWEIFDPCIFVDLSRWWWWFGLEFEINWNHHILYVLWHFMMNFAKSELKNCKNCNRNPERSRNHKLHQAIDRRSTGARRWIRKPRGANWPSGEAMDLIWGFDWIQKGTKSIDVNW